MAEDRRRVLTHVTKRYQRRAPPVLDDVTLDLVPGGHTVLLGDNGSGKSTALATVAGALRPTAGTVAPWGATGYAPERLPARLPFSAREYLGHLGRVRGMHGAPLRARADELLERLGLLPSPDARFEVLSKGNRQKVLLAQAFLAPTATLVLDEPTSGLDAAATRALGVLVDGARRQGTAVLSSAQVPPAWTAPDRVLRIADGALRAEAAPPPAAAVRPPWGPVVVVADPRGGDETFLARVRGVRRPVAAGPGPAVLHVDPAVLDAVLAEVLTRGWSVHSVTPAGGGTAPSP